MKYLLLFFLPILLSCTNSVGTRTASDVDSFQSRKIIPDGNSNRIARLKYELLKDYEKAPNKIAKKSVLEDYQKKLHDYLFDSCKLVLDSIRVTVKKLNPLGGKNFETAFEDDVTEFYATIPFKEDADLKKDSLYSFIKGLSTGKDTTMRFFYLGECNVNDPTNDYIKTFEVNAIPASIHSNINMPKDRRQ